jgi:hypothetical protein
MGYSKRLGVAAVAAVAVSGVLIAPASAAPETDTVTCSGVELTIRTQPSNSDTWGAVQVVSGGSGHLIPTSFSGSAYDSTIGEVIFSFSDTKGGGHANHKQSTTTCTQEFSGTLADLLEPGDEPPPGTSLTDAVTFTFTATVVRKG